MRHIVFLKAIRAPNEEQDDDAPMGAAGKAAPKKGKAGGKKKLAGESPDYEVDASDPAGTAEGQADAESGQQAEDKDAIPEGFGPHNVEEGHHIAFKAGEFMGKGKVAAKGDDGCTVADKTGREHRIHWSEVTGHHPKPE